jgi:hypothetical protein
LFISQGSANQWRNLNAILCKTKQYSALFNTYSHVAYRSQPPFPMPYFDKASNVQISGSNMMYDAARDINLITNINAPSKLGDA